MNVPKGVDVVSREDFVTVRSLRDDEVIVRFRDYRGKSHRVTLSRGSEVRFYDRCWTHPPRFWVQGMPWGDVLLPEWQ